MVDSEYMDGLGLIEGSGEAACLRLFLLAPLTMVIMVAVGLFVFEFFSNQQKDVKSGIAKAGL